MTDTSTGQRIAGRLPRRIQRKRTKGWKMPPNTVSVCRPGKWGNPHKVGTIVDGKPLSAWGAVAMFNANLITGALGYTAKDVIRELRGKNLACWCKEGDPCHADVLLKLANSDAPPPQPTRRELREVE